MLLAGQSRKGHSYQEIKRVYQIFFLNCVLYPDSDKVPRRYSYREEKENDRLSDVTEIIIYEMPKLERYLEEGKINSLSDDKKWCMYMKYRHEKRAARLIKQLSSEEAGIMKAEKAVKGIDRDYLKYIRHMNILKNQMDRAQEIYDMRKEVRAELKEEVRAEVYAESKAEGRTEGRAEGRAEGRTEEKHEIARNLKKMNLSITKIAEITGLSSEIIIKL